MSTPFTNSLGELRVERTLVDDAAMPRVQAVDAAGRVLHAKALAVTAGIEPRALSAFDDAARAASQLAHPCIAPPRLWSASAPPFVATDAIDGEPLAALAGGTLPSELVVALAVDLAEALEAAHAAGVVHGAVGLDAVTVGREGRAILTDFAIAGLASALVNAHSQLLTSMAATLTPEHLNDTPTSAATDVFGLGGALYRLLSGAYPFDAPSPMGMTLKLSMGSFERLEDKAPDAPPALAALVHRMIAPSPSDRPSAREVVLALLELAPREDARRQRIRALLPPPSERPPAPTTPSQPDGVISPAPAPIADPLPPQALPPTAAEPALEWVDTAGFEEGPATEYVPELARAIEAKAGIASPVVIDARREPAARVSAPRLSTPHSRAPSPTPIALYFLIAIFAMLILAGAVVTVLILAG